MVAAIEARIFHIEPVSHRTREIVMNEKHLSTAIRRLQRLIAVRRFTLGVVTGLVFAGSLMATVMAWSGPAAHSDVGVGQMTTGGESIDTLVITDHLYLRGPGGALFDISVAKDASGKAVVNAAPAGG
jgi:hypothetical protein